MEECHSPEAEFRITLRLPLLGLTMAEIDPKRAVPLTKMKKVPLVSAVPAAVPPPVIEIDEVEAPIVSV